jgi:RNA polymerase sigma-70 factor (ECF subfamily)
MGTGSYGHHQRIIPHIRWTVLQHVRSGTREEALVALCRSHWYLLYCVARRRSFHQHDAQDLVQGFFLSILCRKT